MTGNPEERPLASLAGPGLLGGLLMGLANIVPGISGGTMLLAAGVYPDFVQAIADLSRLRFSVRSIVVLGLVAGAACASILLGAGLFKDLVLGYRWVMYALFIGLTLGGVPVVWKLVERPGPNVYGGAVVGFVIMSALAAFQAMGGGGAGSEEASFIALFCGGIAGASAMILPGVSGSYLLLVMDLYVPILTGIDAFKDALKARDVAAAMDPMMGVVLPVGLGVVVGVVVVSNLIKWLLEHRRGTTLGVLLGLLVGAVIGLYPFQEGRQPVPGDVVKGRVVELNETIDQEDWPVVYATPSPTQAMGALGLVGVGFGLTSVVALLGRKENG